MRIFWRLVLESVAAKSYRPLEVIVIDDGSTDETEAVVANVLAPHGAARVLPFSAQSGAVGGVNHGLTLARGAWVAFLDADDVWLPGEDRGSNGRTGDNYPGAGIAWGNALRFQGEGCAGERVRRFADRRVILSTCG